MKDFFAPFLLLALLAPIRDAQGTDLLLQCRGVMPGVGIDPQLRFAADTTHLFSHGAWAAMPYIRRHQQGQTILLDQETSSGGVRELVRTAIDRGSGKFSSVTVWTQDGTSVRGPESQGTCSEVAPR